jgi:hypothetical protein
MARKCFAADGRGGGHDPASPRFSDGVVQRRAARSVAVARRRVATRAIGGRRVRDRHARARSLRRAHARAFSIGELPGPPDARFLFGNSGALRVAKNFTRAPTPITVR